MRTGTLIAAALIVAGVTQGDTLYVSPTGTAQPPYMTWETAATNIQNAVDAAVDGDTVLVTNGTYVLSWQIEVTNGIAVASVHGAEYTIVDGNDSTRCFYTRHNRAVVDGFTIRGGKAYRGGGAYCDSYSTLQNCIISGNTAEAQGGGVYCYGGGKAWNCTISGNSAGFGGGVYCYGGGKALNCIIRGNSAKSGGGARCKGDGTVRNCTISGNVASTGGGVYCDHGGRIQNCTISGNTAEWGLGGGLYGNHGGTIQNSIIYGNSAETGPNHYTYGEGLSYTYCCTTPRVRGEGNLTDDPQFADASYGDYRLLPGSSCIDAGRNHSWLQGSTDLAGRERIGGGRVDMGAFEYHRYDPLWPTFVAEEREGLTPLTVAFAARVAGINTTGLYYQWDFDDDGVVDLEGPGLGEVDYVYRQVGLFSVSLTVSNATGEVAREVKSGYVTSGAKEIHVSGDGSHIYPFTSWATAATNLQDAVDAGVDGTAVVVTNGTYLLSEQITIIDGITVMSVNGAEFTTVDGGSSTRCFALRHSNAAVNGFTICAGNGVGGEFPPQNDYGGGVAIWAGTVENCTISGNSASYGGGVYFHSGGVVQNCTISGNSAGAGGGMYCESGGTVRNCIVTGNWTITLFGVGGGLYCDEGGTVQNCTISGNTGGIRGGGLYCEQGGTIQNSVVRYNSASGDPDYYNEGEGWSYTHCCTTPAVAGEGNVADVPQFADFSYGDYRLRSDSSCIDMGTNLPWMVGSTDFAGRERIAGGIVDIGAYEYHAAEELRCSFRAEGREGVVPLSVTFTAQVEGVPATGLYYRWDFDGDSVTDLEGPGHEQVSHVYAEVGRYTVSLTVSNMAGESVHITKPAYVTSGPVIAYVSPQGSHQYPFTTWAAAATSIQAAVDAGADGTMVLVTNGVYNLAPNGVYKSFAQIDISKGITVASVNGAKSTIVDGNDLADRCFYLSHSNAVVDGFTIRGGGWWDADDWVDGTGVMIWAGTVQHCIITGNNDTWDGGGVFCFPGGTVQDCTISGNSVEGVGGGVYCLGGVVRNCTITGNAASYGGGLYCNSGATVEDCTISGNWLEHSMFPGVGSGVFVGADRAPENGSSTVRNCIIRDNQGVGIASDGGLIENCLITGNSGSGCTGPGSWYDPDPEGHEGSTFRNCVISDNDGWGIMLLSGGTVQNCTVSGNREGGVYCEDGDTIQNSIIYGNSAPGDPNYHNEGEGWSYSYCCTTPAVAGEGNITNAPEFVDARIPDFHLLSTSPCIDAGINQAWMAWAADLDGNPRIIGTTVDMGAYEWPHAAYFIDIKANGADDFVVLGQGELLTVTAQLLADPFIVGDTWILATTTHPFPHSIFAYDLNQNSWVPWLDSLFAPSAQGAIPHLASEAVLQSSEIPGGFYIFYLGYDPVQNRWIDFDELEVDAVPVFIGN